MTHGSPELAHVSLADPGPTIEDISLTDRDRVFNRIITAMEFANSYSLSAAQSAWRGDEEGLKKELTGLRASVMEAIKAFKEL